MATSEERLGIKQFDTNLRDKLRRENALLQKDLVISRAAADAASTQAQLSLELQAEKASAEEKHRADTGRVYIHRESR
ncbi:hypothetical protein V494_02303 [Pseudogymnoascus sp. VKM F-4513 (FW-928)]|nr:hypothetical protein V494_02303 [Pseudogymnoascus sp. VKM F-4513 (FW-928)]